MKLSVSILTYNHEQYIAQAIDSVLMQKTNFDFEILVGEDDSEDSTRAIVKEYKERYPDKIRLFLNERKNVIYIDGRPTGRWNFINNLKHAKGEYIALLEGDDYWTDPYKLQKQVDFLDAYPDFTICFHTVTLVYEDGVKPINRILGAPDGRSIYTLADLFIYHNFMATCSVIFRSRLFGKIPEWFEEVKYADWPLHVLNAQYGKIGYINELMGVYRIHSYGLWSGLNDSEKIEQNINTLRTVGYHLGLSKKTFFKKTLSRKIMDLSREYQKLGDFSRARKAILQSFWLHPFDKIKEKFENLVMLCVPGLITIWKFFKRA